MNAELVSSVVSSAYRGGNNDTDCLVPVTSPVVDGTNASVVCAAMASTAIETATIDDERELFGDMMVILFVVIVMERFEVETDNI